MSPLDGRERISHSAWSLDAFHSTYLRQWVREEILLGRLTGGGSTKSPLGNGKRMNTVKLVSTGSTLIDIL